MKAVLSREWGDPSNLVIEELESSSAGRAKCG